jgi:CHAT domain-containing protein/tetratricopeptide (TPR) repeat protein
MRSSKCRVILAVSGLAWLGAAQQPADTAVRLAIQRLHAAYIAQDLDGVVALWSGHSPHRAAGREQALKWFAGSAAGIRETTVRDPEVEGDRAHVRIDREIAAANVRLVLEFVKEQGEWKIWKETAASEDLSVRLVAASTDQEQAGLLSTNQDLIDPDLASALVDRGREARDRGDSERALKSFGLAQALGERGGPFQARAVNGIGLVHFDRGDYAEALNWYQKSLAISESLHDDRGIARTLNNIGAVYNDAGDSSLAWESFQKTLTLGEKLHNDEVMANATANMALVYGQRGDYLHALSLLKRSYDLSAPGGDKRALSVIFVNLGNVFLWQGDYAQAEEYFRRSLAMAESGGLKRLTGYAYMSLGHAAEFRGDLQEAIRKYEKSLAICAQVEDKFCTAATHSYLGSAFSLLGEQTKALEFFQKALEIHKAIGDGSEIPLAMARMAAVYNRKGEFQEALRVAQEAGRLGAASGLREAVWRAHLEAGNAQQALHESARAEAEFSSAIATIEEMRLDVAGAESERENFFEDKLEPYHRMLGLLVSSGRTAEAFGYAERAKARVLVEVLKNGRTQLSGTMTPGERRHDRDLMIKLASLNTRLMRAGHSSPPNPGVLAGLTSDLNQTRLDYAGYRTILYAAHPELRLQNGAVEPVTLVQAAQVLPGADAAFVEFVVTDEKLYTFVSGGGAEPKDTATVKVFTSPLSRKELTERVERFRHQLETRDLRFRSSAAELYRLLFGPAGSDLLRRRRVILVPDGVLWELPFQALVDRSGEYLLDRWAISYAPSITALHAMVEMKRQRKPAPGQTQLLAMGNPVSGPAEAERVKTLYQDRDLGSLPLAETEVRRLGRIYGEKQSRIYIGPEARESRFKAEAAAPNVLHLATHGILNNASPLYSYILLAGDGEGDAEDGLLEAWELMQMKLNAQLAVLSACETARGRVGAGEGVVGLSWALFVAGVPATVLSQWKVASDSTSRLMVAFHQNRQNGMSDAAALRAAALTIRKDPVYRHPFYWAPFIAIGASLQ